MKQLIERYKRLRNRHRLKQTYDNAFAFVGVGNHSMDNLYPVLDYLHVPLKYICCKSKDKLPLIERRWKGVHGTTSLDEILADDEIKGVFVSATPAAHFAIAKKVLESRKALFIEKPPCQTMQELQQLIELEQSLVVVGMQKRYAPATKILEKRLKKETLLSYNYKYLTGAYPEGNALTDLFIHPLDYVCHLFGKAEVCGYEHIQGRTEHTILLTLKHKAVTGILELSTAYSWQNANETLTINTEQGTYELTRMENLTFTPKQGHLLGIPLEKVILRNTITEVLFSRNNFIPTATNNQIYTQGYLPEIKTFVDALHTNPLKPDRHLRPSIPNPLKTDSHPNPTHGFSSLYHTYSLITSINNRSTVSK